MKRQVSLEEISDGRLYGKNDMVRADCGGCHGCFACCQGMGVSAILDPLDIYRLTVGLSLTFEELMEDKIELNVADGVILPNLKMSGDDERCAFLDRAGRCSIHPQRPGICRLFPLGRYYPPREGEQDAETAGSGTSLLEGNVLRQSEQGAETAGDGTAANGSARPAIGFRYFLQVHECPMPNRTKVKVRKWVDTPELDRYERFVNDWHDFLEEVQGRLSQETEEELRKINLLLLKLFYVRPYEKEDFYGQFEARLAAAREAFR